MSQKIRLLWNFLLNPFKYFSRNQMLTIGLAVILLTGIINYFTNTHFDGIFDIHTGKSATIYIFISEGFINLIIITLCLYFPAKTITDSNINIYNFFIL
mgnify:FL=1